jgi:hypothetical protein
MNDKELIELVNAVNSIEEDILDSTGGVEYFNMSMETNGFVYQVRFLNIVLWSSEDDIRNYDETNNEYEPFEPYLRRMLGEELVKLKTIKESPGKEPGQERED